jgi:hypothetical protein
MPEETYADAASGATAAMPTALQVNACSDRALTFSQPVDGKADSELEEGELVEPLSKKQARSRERRSASRNKSGSPLTVRPETYVSGHVSVISVCVS